MQQDTLIVLGPVIHCLSFGNLEIIPMATISVDLKTGVIFDISENLNLPEDYDANRIKVVRLGENQFICPGFIDTHHHAPQTSNLGLGLDLELLQWLNRYTFPSEQSYSTRSSESITSEYLEMTARLLRAGTTTCVYFGSLQLEANKILVDAIAEKGQRAFVGKVCMDQNSPIDYIESLEKSVKDTEKLITYINSNPSIVKSGLIKPMITPRFAPTCSMALMKELGALAERHNCHIQTHVSENLSEVAWVRELFPSNTSYSQVYDEAKLLPTKTVLAHGIHLDETEKQLIKDRGASISHCPNSNFALSSGCLNLRDLLQRNIKVSLGTDVSGGYSPNMLDACRQAIIASKVIHFNDRKSFKPLTAIEAFSLATLNGAICLGMEKQLGNFQIGKFFDALIVDIYANPQIPRGKMKSNSDVEELRDLFEKFIFCGDDRCIVGIFVNGNQLQIK